MISACCLFLMVPYSCIICSLWLSGYGSPTSCMRRPSQRSKFKDLNFKIDTVKERLHSKTFNEIVQETQRHAKLDKLRFLGIYTSWPAHKVRHTDSKIYHEIEYPRQHHGQEIPPRELCRPGLSATVISVIFTGWLVKTRNSDMVRRPVSTHVNRSVPSWSWVLI